jgi:hypothetical protein
MHARASHPHKEEGETKLTMHTEKKRKNRGLVCTEKESFKAAPLWCAAEQFPVLVKHGLTSCIYSSKTRFTNTDFANKRSYTKPYAFSHCVKKMRA